MKKIIFPVLVTLLALTSCGGSDDSKGHIISGEIANAEGETAILRVFEDRKEVPLDTVQIVNGKFEFETNTKELREYILLVGEDEIPVILFLDENSEDVTITGSLPGIGDNYEVTGSDISVEVKEYLTFLKPMFEDEKLLYLQLRQTLPTDTFTINTLLARMDSIAQIQRDYAIEHIEANPSSPTSWLMLGEFIPVTGLIDFDTAYFAYFQKVADGLRGKYAYSDLPDIIEDDMASIRAQLKEMEKSMSFSADFEYAPEIEMADRNGSTLALSSLKGKVVLIDFWASWCGPCRRENPNVVNMYNKYKDKGFTVFSVSLDDDKDAWLRAIEADNLIWPNHVSDLKGWQSSAAADYGVNAIPATFLIDEEGKVIGTNLRGPELEQKLQEVLG